MWLVDAGKFDGHIKLLGTHLKRNGEQTIDGQRAGRYAGAVGDVNLHNSWGN
jgi:hypothetical protein